jgi:hypothetical protein
MSTVQEFGTQTATAEKVNTSQGQTTRVNATEVQTVVVNEVPSWIVLLLVVGWLMPSPNEIGRTVRGWLQAKKHLKQYSLRAVADWLSHESGRSISDTCSTNTLRGEHIIKKEANFGYSMLGNITKLQWSLVQKKSHQKSTTISFTDPL